MIITRVKNDSRTTRDQPNTTLVRDPGRRSKIIRPRWPTGSVASFSALVSDIKSFSISSSRWALAVLSGMRPIGKSLPLRQMLRWASTISMADKSAMAVTEVDR